MAVSNQNGHGVTSVLAGSGMAKVFPGAAKFNNPIQMDGSAAKSAYQAPKGNRGTGHPTGVTGTAPKGQ